MESIARTAENFGQDFLDSIRANGSKPLTSPLLTFLEKSNSNAPLRSIVKLCLPALKADIAHFLNICFGRHPGIVDHAGSKITDQVARQWLVQAIDGFSIERTFLNRLAVAAGPIHRQIGQDRVNSLLEGQTRSVEMLATSDRAGCPAGAAIAFVIDWQATRPLLENVALALSLEVPKCLLPSEQLTTQLASNLGDNQAMRRAMLFGGEQMLALQRGFWQLIVARHQAMLAEQ